MQSFKRSKDKLKSPVTPVKRSGSHSSQVKNEVPMKVIKALYDYEAQGPGELRFQKGDFFHVVSETEPQWYEATNPMTRVKGMVPKSYFETFGRTRPVATTPESPTRITTLYGVVLYDFSSERPDELSVSVDEHLLICAHHDFEWFIAKPIVKVGGPGLVPVSYVKLLDTKGNASDMDNTQMIMNANLPTIEVWKEYNAKYKASSIQAGTPSTSSDSPISFGGLSKKSSLSRTITSTSATSLGNFARFEHLLEIAPVHVVEAAVESFAFTNNKYWFLVKAYMSNGLTRSLCRYYQDFFEFQKTLLEAFPKEASKQHGSQRILPYIPGPLPNVGDAVSNRRRGSLDEYVKKLVALPDYISKSKLVLSLFEVRTGDKEYLNSRDNLMPDPRLSIPASVASQQHETRNSQYQIDRLSHYEKSSTPNLTSRLSGMNLLSNESPNGSVQSKKIKLKFYFEDDIFATQVPQDISLVDLKVTIAASLDITDRDTLRIFPKDESNVDDTNYNASSELLSDEALWECKNFVDKGKILLVQHNG